MGPSFDFTSPNPAQIKSIKALILPALITVKIIYSAKLVF